MDGFYLWSCVFAERTPAYAEEDRTYREQIKILKELPGGVIRDAVAVSYCCGLELNYIFRNHPRRVGRLAGAPGTVPDGTFSQCVGYPDRWSVIVEMKTKCPILMLGYFRIRTLLLKGLNIQPKKL